MGENTKKAPHFFNYAYLQKKAGPKFRARFFITHLTKLIT